MSLVVQKFGGSVLRSDDDVRRAAREVARTVAAGHRVVAVVSALAGITDGLLARAKNISSETGGPAEAGGPNASAATDLLVATGEIESAALLGLALAAHGVPSEALNPWQIGIHTDETPGGARIAGIDPTILRERLPRSSALVVPGFVGRGPDDRLTTLGRGGSDLTAIALADALGAESCEFFKDVPGWFSADPDLVPDAIHRPEVAIDEALELSRSGCRFLQDRALAWAASSRCQVLIRAFDDPRATRITGARGGPGADILAMTHEESGDGAHVSISIVGRQEAILDPDLPGALEAVLADAGIPAHAARASRHRIAIRVPRDRASSSQDLIHDRFVAAPSRAAL